MRRHGNGDESTAFLGPACTDTLRSMTGNEGASDVHPTQVARGNYIRTDPQGPWKKVLSIRDGEIQVGRVGRGSAPLGPPSITPARVEPSVIFGVENGEEINQPTVDPISAKTKQVPANDVGRGDIVQHPETGVWITVTNIVEGVQGHKHPGGHDKTDTYFFTGEDFEGTQHTFDSYLTTAAANPALAPRNEVITRLVRE